MHPLTCYAGQISLCHAKIEKISKKNFVIINKDGGGGQFWIYGGDTAVMRGDIELMAPSPPTRENPDMPTYLANIFHIGLSSVL